MLLHDNDNVQTDHFIARPDCPKCGTRMWLDRIEPDEPDHDLRTYECPECDHTIMEVVKYK